MGFIAKNFSFDHVPCEKYGLRIFDIDSNNNIATPFASSGELQTDTISSKGKTFLYGRSLNRPLEFSLIFGIDPSRVAMNDYFDRYEMNAIATWLIGQNTYKWLEIEQPDLEMIRYHCIISDLEPIQLSWLPWAFSAKIVCDSPYGYRFPKKFNYVCNGSTSISLLSRSTISDFYYPKLDIQLNGSNTVSIINQSCNNVELNFKNMPRSSSATISVDNDLGIIESSDGMNVYQYCNFGWLPLKRGKNKMLITGKCILDFICEFPVDVGG